MVCGRTAECARPRSSPARSTGYAERLGGEGGRERQEPRARRRSASRPLTLQAAAPGRSRTCKRCSACIWQPARESWALGEMERVRSAGRAAGGRRAAAGEGMAAQATAAVASCREGHTPLSQRKQGREKVTTPGRLSWRARATSSSITVPPAWGEGARRGKPVELRGDAQHRVLNAVVTSGSRLTSPALKRERCRCW